MRRRQWLWLGLPLALFAGACAFGRAKVSGAQADARAAPGASTATSTATSTFARIMEEVSIASIVAKPADTTASLAPPIAGIDLTKMSEAQGGYVVGLDSKKSVRLTLDTKLQHTTLAALARYKIPEVAIVAMDPDTGRVLAYASALESGTARDLNVEATAPSASVFKVVTATTLVNEAKLTAETKQCYSGGEQRLTERDLVPNEARDKYCTTLAGAMGRSLNTVFARLAVNHLKSEQLEKQARLLGYADALPFDVPVQASSLTIPKDGLPFARTAAGFWNSTLSPLHAAWLMSTVARGGEPIRPFIVSDVLDEDGKATYHADHAPVMARAMPQQVAEELIPMLENTVTDGTSFKAFHDRKGQAFVPGVSVAGKTGTLTDAEKNRYYTWFAGFAPSRPMPNVKRIAVAVLVVNGPNWKVKANTVAKDVFRAYYTQDRPVAVAPSAAPAGTASAPVLGAAPTDNPAATGTKVHPARLRTHRR
jgi:penicillin-binding protein A